MNTEHKFPQGTVVWSDLTVSDAEKIRDFYMQVVGWKTEPVDMGGYHDFNMISPITGETMAGICHSRKGNATLPSQWLMYITVDNLEESIQACEQLGGELLVAPRVMGEYGRFCVIKDPAGAVAALYEQKS